MGIRLMHVAIRVMSGKLSVFVFLVNRFPNILNASKKTNSRIVVGYIFHDEKKAHFFVDTC